MVDVNIKKCSHVGCLKGATFGVAGTKKRVFCAGHAKEGMVGVSKRRCSHVGRLKGGSYGIAGTKKREFCAGHAEEGMVGISNRKCSHVGCLKRASCGEAGTKERDSWAGHAKEGMVHLIHHECARRGCSKAPSFGVVGSTRRDFCAGHAKEGIVNVKRALDRARGSKRDREAPTARSASSNVLDAAPPPGGSTSISSSGTTAASTTAPRSLGSRLSEDRAPSYSQPIRFSGDTMGRQGVNRVRQKRGDKLRGTSASLGAEEPAQETAVGAGSRPPRSRTGQGDRARAAVEVEDVTVPWGKRRASPRALVAASTASARAALRHRAGVAVAAATSEGIKQATRMWLSWSPKPLTRPRGRWQGRGTGQTSRSSGKAVRTVSGGKHAATDRHGQQLWRNARARRGQR